MEEIKDRIQKAMDLRNMRQQDIIEKAGLSSSTISQYLSGRNKPKQDNIYRLATVLNVNPAWLMGYDTTIEWKDNEMVTRREKEFLDAVRLLDDEDKARIMERVSVLLEQEKYRG